MNYHFTDAVRLVLADAREEAIALHHDYVGTEHALLALTRESRGSARSVLWKGNVRPAVIREAVLKMLRPGQAGPAREARSGGRRVPKELPYTSRQKKALEYAMAEARLMHHDYVGTEHLLMGLLREERSIAAQILRDHGLEREKARALVFGEGGAADADEASLFIVTIDDASIASIYEQIIAQVQEGIATGVLAPGERLPTVRRLADELDIAPGTVARAYGELERLGVVVTEGARGTRVAERKRAGLGNDARGETLVGLLRPVVVAAFHLGASADELRGALEPAMAGIFETE